MLKFLARSFLAPLAKVVFRPTVTGKDNVPRTGPVLIASNHLSFIDSVVITLVSPRSVSFLAKSEYFSGTGFKGAVSRNFFTSIGAIPVERGAGQAAQAALDAGLGVLENDEAFAIYPEGTRSLDGRLYKGKTGVAWLALSANSLIVPVALSGTEKLLPKGAKFPRITPITVHFGRPIDSAEYGLASSAKSRRKLTDEVMEQIHQMSPQELANAYNESPNVPVAEKVKRVLNRNKPQ